MSDKKGHAPNTFFENEELYILAAPIHPGTLETAMTRLGFSARAYDRSLKVARTIADLAEEENISPAHLSEAILYRMMDRYY